MHNTPLVSVIIPCYNDYQYINQAVESIQGQDYKNIEIIIIDDGSDEKTKSILEDLQKENVTIIFQENAGPSAARNNGIKLAKGEYILTLDADDYFERTFVDKAVSILNTDLDSGLVTCYAHVFNKKGITGEIISKEGNANDFLFYNSAIGNSLFRKKCWLDIDGFDENMKKGFEDWDFHISLLKANWKIKVISEYLFYYRDKPNSRNKSANKFFKYDLMIYVYVKHRDLSIENFDRLVSDILLKMKYLSVKNNNIKDSLDYKIGNLLLRPFRFLKRMLIKNSKIVL